MDEWVAAWSAADMEQVVALFTDDCLYEDVPMGALNRGHDELRTLAGGVVLAATPGVRIDLTARFLTGQRGAMEWVMSGCWQTELRELPAVGKEFWIRGASVLQLRDGKIVRCSDYWDFAALMRSLGLLP